MSITFGSLLDKLHSGGFPELAHQVDGVAVSPELLLNLKPFMPGVLGGLFAIKRPCQINALCFTSWDGGRQEKERSELRQSTMIFTSLDRNYLHSPVWGVEDERLGMTRDLDFHIAYWGGWRPVGGILSSDAEIATAKETA